MKVYIQTDIEGVAGFCFFENRKDASVENFNHRQRMRRLLTNEVNTAVTAAFESGADEANSKAIVPLSDKRKVCLKRARMRCWKPALRRVK